VKHTPEPWGLSIYPDSLVIVAGRGFSVCDCVPGNPIDISADEAIANARRIVACVNACSGITTEELEEEGKDALDISDGIAELGKQRDALVIALKAAVEVIHSWHNTGDERLEEVWPIYLENSPEMKVIREALASCVTVQ
jgi:hypothetical protein